VNTAPSIPAMAQASAARWGDRLAVSDGESQLTFVDVADQMMDIARALVALGIEPGDCVAVWAPNCAAFITAALGIQAAGASLVPLNTRLRGEEAAYILDKVDASAIFTVDGFLNTDYEGMLRAADPSLRALRCAIDLPGPGARSTPKWESLRFRDPRRWSHPRGRRHDRLRAHPPRQLQGPATCRFHR
jgi:HIP---CoA ligase